MLERLGLRKRRPDDLVQLVPEIDPAAAALIRAVAPYTMSGPERIWSLISSVRHVVRAGIPGEVIECGVWRGGNLIVAAEVLRALGERRVIRGYDTFAGMSEPTVEDVSFTGGVAASRWSQTVKDDHSEWSYSPIEEVSANVARFVPDTDVRLIKGKCEETLKVEENLPETVAVLRLDTDWYESTLVELEVLWPRLSPGGILIVDDYGHWGGSRKAVDEYFAGRPVFLSRVDYTARLVIKS
ncbi:MAG: TylF/MycF/NovP-related O-methyltransferase [Siculibacillus sp.]